MNNKFLYTIFNEKFKRLELVIGQDFRKNFVFTLVSQFHLRIYKSVIHLITLNFWTKISSSPYRKKKTFYNKCDSYRFLRSKTSSLFYMTQDFPQILYDKGDYSQFLGQRMLRLYGLFSTAWFQLPLIQALAAASRT